MSDNQTNYDIFISYARVDNAESWIKAYVDALVAEFRRITGGRELRYFWDTERIPDFSHWQMEIFNEGIAKSKLFLAFLSPNYLVSEVCRREWRAWIEREIGMHILTKGASPIYIVEIPAMFGNPMPPEHKTARLVAELCKLPLPHDPFIREAEGVIREFRRRQLHDVQPFYQAGLNALLQNDLKSQLEKLAREIDTKSEQIRRAAASESTVPVYNPNFTGRVDELIELRQMLTDNSTGVVAGIHGLGGIGKTELAFTFAHAYAGVYPGGRYYIRCEGESSLVSAFGRFEDDPFRNVISDTERKDPEANFNAVLRALKNRLKEKGPVLLVLDNVSKPELLHPGEISRVTKLSPEVHLLATTRLPSLPRADGFKTLMLGELKPEDALALLEKYRPFANQDERQAAVEIVQRLGGFALAIELVAGRLLVRKTVTYRGILQNLGLEMLDIIAGYQDVVLQRHNHEKRLEQVLKPTLAELSPAALCLLRFAALLPPDRIVLPWLRYLVLQHYPELAEPGLDGEDQWTELIYRLYQLSLFNGVFAANDLPTTTRLHRLIGDFVRREIDPGLGTELRAYVAMRAETVYNDPDRPADWELDGLAEVIPHLLRAEHDHRLAVAGMAISDNVLDYRNLPTALALLTATGSVIRQLAEADPTSAVKQRDLSVSYNKLGDVSKLAGDLQAARDFFEKGLGISRKLAEDDPDRNNADKQRDLFVSYIKLGDVSMSSGDLQAARDFFEKGLGISFELAEDDPDRNNADKQRDLSVSYIKLGDVSKLAGNLQAARDYFDKGLGIRRKLAEDDPDRNNADKQRDLSITFYKLGEVSQEEGNLKAARVYFEDGLRISRKLAKDDPTNAVKKSDLSNSYDRLGVVSKAERDLKAARDYFEKGLRIRRKLAKRDPTNAVKKRDLFVSYDRLGDVSKAEGNLKTAQVYFKKGLRISRKLAKDDPTNADKKRDLSYSYEVLGDVSVAAGDLKAARVYFEDGLRIRRKLAKRDPNSAQKQSDLSRSLAKLAELSMKEEDWQTALAFMEPSLAICEQLAGMDPLNQIWQNNVQVSRRMVKQIQERLS